MSKIPEHLKYAATHEWADKQDDGSVRSALLTMPNPNWAT